MNLKERMNKMKNRGKKSAYKVEERNGNGVKKKKLFFLNTDKEIIGNLELNHFVPKVTKGKERNLIDVLPFRVTQSWYSNMLTYNKEEVGINPDEYDYKLEIPIHTIGSQDSLKQILCLREAFGQKCSICDKMFKHYKNGEKDEGNSLQPRWRVFYNVYDYNNPDLGIQIMERPFTFEKYLMASSGLDVSEEENEEVDPIYYFDLEDGMTLSFQGVKKTFNGNDYVEVTSFDFIEREQAYDEDVVNQTFPFDQMVPIPTEEEVREIFLKYEEGDDTDDESVSEENTEDESEEDTEEELPFEPDDKCPAGGMIGEDFNSFTECQDCEKQEICKDEFAVLEKEKEKEEKKSKPKQRKRTFGPRK